VILYNKKRKENYFRDTLAPEVFYMQRKKKYNNNKRQIKEKKKRKPLGPG